MSSTECLNPVTCAQKRHLSTPMSSSNSSSRERRDDLCGLYNHRKAPDDTVGVVRLGLGFKHIEHEGGQAPIEGVLSEESRERRK